MTDRLLLDTHIAIWHEGGDQRLRAGTRELLDNCWRQGGAILLSAVSVWEMAMLSDVGRLRLRIPLELWVERFLNQPGFEVMPLDHRAAARSYRLDGLERRDPADRLLIATAIELGCPLVTYDGYITSFAQRHGERYRFSVVA